MRIDALTGLRIVAALLVFLSHVASPVVPLPFSTVMQAGYNGVTVFFVLSGFVLAWNYSDRVQNRAELWAFAVARIARIYPLYLFALLLTVMISRVPPDPSIVWHVFAMQTWSGDLATAFGYNGPAWSIGVEFFLYACFPLVVLALSRARVVVLWVTAAASVLVLFAITGTFVILGLDQLPPSDPASDHRWLYHTPLLRLGDFVVGVVAALIVKRGHPVPSWAGWVAQALGVAAFVILMGDQRLLNSAWSWDVAYMVPAFLVLWGFAVARTPLTVFLGSRPMVVLGEASFAFYLLHAPILHLLALPQPESLPGWLLSTSLQFTIIALAAIGAHFFIERPAQQALRKALIRS